MTSERDIERILDHWFTERPTQVADRVLDEAADRIARQPQQPAWRLSLRDSHVNTYLKPLLAAAAVLVIAVIGWNLLPGGSTGIGGPQSTESPPSTPSPTASPTPEPTPSPTPAPAAMDLQGDDAYWTATVPAGWTGVGSSRLTASQGFGGPTGLTIGASGAVNVPSDPCDGVGEYSDAASPADVVATLEARDDLVVSDPIDATLGGLAGLRVDVEMPADFGACGEVFLFAEPDGSGIPALGPSNLFRIWIVDVDGRPVVFWISSFAGTPADDLVEAQQIMDSIVITP